MFWLSGGFLLYETVGSGTKAENASDCHNKQWLRLFQVPGCFKGLLQPNQLFLKMLKQDTTNTFIFFHVKSPVYL